MPLLEGLDLRQHLGHLPPQLRLRRSRIRGARPLRVALVQPRLEVLAQLNLRLHSVGMYSASPASSRASSTGMPGPSPLALLLSAARILDTAASSSSVSLSRSLKLPAAPRHTAGWSSSRTRRTPSSTSSTLW